MRSADSQPGVTVGALFVGFAQMGLSGFGGVLPWAYRIIVEERRWITAAEFTELVSLCQILPGPNIVNVSVCLGARFQGARGAAAAFLGLMLAPVSIVLLLATFYARFAHLAPFHGALLGMATAAAGLMAGTGLKMAAAKGRRLRDACFTGVVFMGIAILHWPLLPVLLVVAPLSIATAFAQARQ